MEELTPLMWNPILRQYVVNAPHRINRREGTTTCPFCADAAGGKVDICRYAGLAASK